MESVQERPERLSKAKESSCIDFSQVGDRYGLLSVVSVIFLSIFRERTEDGRTAPAVTFTIEF